VFWPWARDPNKTNQQIIAIENGYKYRYSGFDGNPLTIFAETKIPEIEERIHSPQKFVLPTYRKVLASPEKSLPFFVSDARVPQPVLGWGFVVRYLFIRRNQLKPQLQTRKPSADEALAFSCKSFVSLAKRAIYPSRLTPT
jgi:hypothetical protein